MVGRPKEPFVRALHPRPKILPTVRPSRHHLVRECPDASPTADDANGNELLPAPEDEAVLVGLKGSLVVVVGNPAIRLTQDRRPSDLPACARDSMRSGR